MLVLPILLTFAINNYSYNASLDMTSIYYSTTCTTSSGVISLDDNSSYYNEPYTLTSEIIFHFDLTTDPSNPYFFFIGLSGIRIDSYLSTYSELYPDDYAYHWSRNVSYFPDAVGDDEPIWSDSNLPFTNYDPMDDLEYLKLDIGVLNNYGQCAYIYYLYYKDTILDSYIINIPSPYNNMYVSTSSVITFEDPVNTFYAQIENYWHNRYFPDVNASYQEGYDVGYSDGNRTGYNEGYTEGYNDASSQSEVATSIFLGIINIALLPINMFLKMLNFEVFGINIGGFVSALLTVAIAVILIRIIFGGNKSGS